MGKQKSHIYERIEDQGPTYERVAIEEVERAVRAIAFATISSGKKPVVGHTVRSVTFDT